MLGSTNASHHQSSVSCHSEMAEVALAHDAVIVTVLDAGATFLERLTWWFSPRARVLRLLPLSL